MKPALSRPLAQPWGVFGPGHVTAPQQRSLLAHQTWAKRRQLGHYTKPGSQHCTVHLHGPGAGLPWALSPVCSPAARLRPWVTVTNFLLPLRAGQSQLSHGVRPAPRRLSAFPAPRCIVWSLPLCLTGPLTPITPSFLFHRPLTSHLAGGQSEGKRYSNPITAQVWLKASLSFLSFNGDFGCLHLAGVPEATSCTSNAGQSLSQWQHVEQNSQITPLPKQKVLQQHKEELPKTE